MSLLVLIMNPGLYPEFRIIHERLTVHSKLLQAWVFMLSGHFSSKELVNTSPTLQLCSLSNNRLSEARVLLHIRWKICTSSLEIKFLFILFWQSHCGCVYVMEWHTPHQQINSHMLWCHKLWLCQCFSSLTPHSHLCQFLVFSNKLSCTPAQLFLIVVHFLKETHMI